MTVIHMIIMSYNFIRIINKIFQDFYFYSYLNFNLNLFFYIIHNRLTDTVPI